MNTNQSTVPPVVLSTTLPSRTPRAWERKWSVDGEIPKKEKNENGRWVWPKKFKLLPVTKNKCLPDDVPLYAMQDIFEVNDVKT